MTTLDPVQLPPNQPPDRFYRGGRRIAEFRGIPYTGGNIPEDWLGSATPLFGEHQLGLTRLPDGRLLQDALAQEPVAWLGSAHLARWGHDPKLLTKLLDAGQRLPVHFHPDGAFAQRHLGCAHGKAEAWIILSPGTVHVGLRRDVEHRELLELIHQQDAERLLGLLHSIEVEPGDAVFVPAGVPHAIGEGILLVEVQEPEDMSVLLEYSGFDLSPGSPTELGLGEALALQAMRTTGYSEDEVAALIKRGPTSGAALPKEADDFFRADWIEGGAIDRGYGVLVVTKGEGVLRFSSASHPVSRGDVWLIPHSARAELEGVVKALFCRPPAPEPGA